MESRSHLAFCSHGVRFQLTQLALPMTVLHLSRGHGRQIRQPRQFFYGWSRRLPCWHLFALFFSRVRRFHAGWARSDDQPTQYECSDKIYPEERISDMFSQQISHMDGLKSAVCPSPPSSPCPSLTSTLTTLCSMSWPRPVALLRPARPALMKRGASKPAPPQSLAGSAAPISRAQLVRFNQPQAEHPLAEGEALASTPSEVSVEALPVPQPPAGPPPEGTRAFGRLLNTTTLAWSPCGRSARSVGHAHGMIVAAVPRLQTVGLRGAAATSSPVSSSFNGAPDLPPHLEESL